MDELPKRGSLGNQKPKTALQNFVSKPRPGRAIVRVVAVLGLIGFCIWLATPNLMR